MKLILLRNSTNPQPGEVKLYGIVTLVLFVELFVVLFSAIAGANPLPIGISSCWTIGSNRLLFMVKFLILEKLLLDNVLFLFKKVTNPLPSPDGGGDGISCKCNSVLFFCSRDVANPLPTPFFPFTGNIKRPKIINTAKIFISLRMAHHLFRRIIPSTINYLPNRYQFSYAYVFVMDNQIKLLSFRSDGTNPLPGGIVSLVLFVGLFIVSFYAIDGANPLPSGSVTGCWNVD